MIGVFRSISQSARRAKRSTLLEDLYLLAARESYASDWGWSQGEEWQCMRHRSSSLVDSLRRVPNFLIREWAMREQRGDLGRSWLRIYRHKGRGQLWIRGLGAGRMSLSIGFA